MRVAILFSIFFLFFQSFPAVCSFDMESSSTENSIVNKDQDYLMSFVMNYNSQKSSKLFTVMAKEALKKIHEIYKKIKNKAKTYAFFKNLLNSNQYRNLFPDIYYYLSDFYPLKKQDYFLLKSYKYSKSFKDKQFALKNLYKYFKRKGVSYLELSYLLKLIALQESQNDVIGLENSYRLLAENYRNKGDYLIALEYFFEALLISEKYKIKQDGDIYLKISEIFRILNRKELSKKYIQKALEISRLTKNGNLEVKALCASSKFYYDSYNYPRALRYINLALSIEESQQKYICGVLSYYQKALILLRMQECEKNIPQDTYKMLPISLLKNAVEIGLEKKRYEELLPIMTDYLERLIARGNMSESEGYIRRIDDIYAPYYPYYFFYFYLQAIYYEKMEQIDLALIYYQKTIEKLEKYFEGLKNQQYYRYREKIEYVFTRIIEFYLKMYNRTEKSFYIKKALYFSEIKNAFFFELLTDKSRTYYRFIEEKKKLEQEWLNCNNEYQNQLNQKGSADSQKIKRLETQLSEIEIQHEELRELILECPLTYRKNFFKDFNLRLIQKRLNPGQLIVKYVVLKNNIYVFCIDHFSTVYWKLPGSTKYILGKINRLAEPLDDFTEGNVDYLRINYDLQLAYQLYHILIKDIWEFRENIDELFIIPDNELFKLPFEGLVTGFNQRELQPEIIFSEYRSANYLIEKLPISYFFSLFHFQKKENPPKQREYLIAAYGDPHVKGDKYTINFNGMGFKNPNRIKGADRNANKLTPSFYKELPSSKREILEIQKLFGKEKVRLFLGDQFNRQSFEEFAPRAKILHIATHFINNMNYPHYSALLFSSINNSNPFYFSHDVFGLKLGNELVVLSACESSEKHLLGLQGLRGMTASFYNAGVHSMIVSMWPVDEHSSLLTLFLYREYKENMRPESFSEALRKAKLKLMKHTSLIENGMNISYSHPFLWGNYILYHFR